MIMGGVVTEYISWRPVFYIIAGVAVLPLVGTYFLVPNLKPSKEDNKRIDWLGGALVTVGLILLLFVLADGLNAPNGWKTGCE
jgi:predicted MFS family arabinose efflux permease